MRRRSRPRSSGCASSGRPRLVVSSPGGGGFGDPLDRGPGAGAPGRARRRGFRRCGPGTSTGVVLASGGRAIDADATSLRRSTMRGADLAGRAAHVTRCAGRRLTLAIAGKTVHRIRKAIDTGHRMYKRCAARLGGRGPVHPRDRDAQSNIPPRWRCATGDVGAHRRTGGVFAPPIRKEAAMSSHSRAPLSSRHRRRRRGRRVGALPPRQARLDRCRAGRALGAHGRLVVARGRRRARAQRGPQHGRAPGVHHRSAVRDREGVRPGHRAAHDGRGSRSPRCRSAGSGCRRRTGSSRPSGSRTAT